MRMLRTHASSLFSSEGELRQSAVAQAKARPHESDPVGSTRHEARPRRNSRLWMEAGAEEASREGDEGLR